MFVNFNILNQLGSPAINSNTFANRPAAGQTGRLFVSTDTYEIYRDNGTTWDLIGGPGSSTITGTGTATQVAYFTSSQAIGSSANLFWDNTSGFLGVGTAAPTTRIEAVKTDGIGIYANFTTNAGSGSSTTGIYSKNTTNSSGYAAVIEESTPNTTAGQYPLLIKHSLSSGTAGVGMGTGLQFQLPDDAGTFKTTQLTIETINAAAATYATRYRFNVQNNGSSTPVAYINATGLGIFTATPGAALDIHSTGIMAQLNSTSATANSLLAFQRSGSGLWRIGDNYGSGTNYFELFNTVLGINAMQVFAATNKTSWQATETYTTGLARGNYFDYNLSVAAGGSFTSPNAITALGASLDLTLAGNATIPSGARSGLDAYNSIAFTGAGTLTHNQGTQIRAYSNVTAGWAFNGSAVGTITHLAGLRALFPDNSGSAVNVTNNYALLLNDQSANTGTVTYTNRWGIYQEGASDLNYFAANTLIGTTTNAGYKLDIAGTSRIAGPTGSPGLYVSGNMNGNYPAQNEGICFGQNFQAGIVDVGFWNTYSPSVFPNTRFAWYQQTGASSSNLLMTLLNSGNLGLGVTPNAWGNWKALELLNGVAVGSYNFSGTPIGWFGSNAYSDGSNDRYVVSAAAANYLQDQGVHKWRIAGSGTAGNTITWTQAMTLDASGNILIGMTTAPGDGAVAIKRTGAQAASIKFHNASTGDSSGDGLYIGYGGSDSTIAYIYQRENNILIFGTNNTDRGRFTSGGNFLIGTTTDNGSLLQVNGDQYTNGNVLVNQTSQGNGGTVSVNGTISIGTTTNGTQSSMAKDGVQRATGVSTGAGTIFTSFVQGMSSASCGYFIIYGDDNSANGFIDVVIARGSQTPVVISSSTVRGTPAARTYTTSTDNLQLAMGSGTYNVNVKCTTMGYPF